MGFDGRVGNFFCLGERGEMRGFRSCVKGSISTALGGRKSTKVFTSLNQIPRIGPI